MRKVESGISVRQAAGQLLVDYSCALNWVRRVRRTGSVAAYRQGGYRQPILLAHTSWLLERIKEKPDLTLAEIRESLFQKGIQVGIATLWRFFKRHQISFKKSFARPGTGS